MTTKSILIHVDDKEVEVVLKSARKADGIWRAELIVEAVKMDSTGKDMKAQVAFYLYPTCVAAVKEPDWVREMSLDEFLTRVDEADIDLWTGVAYDLNPQWKDAFKALTEIGKEAEKMSAEAEKKILTSEPGLTPPTEA